MPLIKQSILYLREVHSRLIAGHNFEYSSNHLVKSYAEIEGQCASDLIKNKLLEGDPFLVARFGSVELNALVNFLSICENKKHPLQSVLKFVAKKRPYSFWWDQLALFELKNNAGFFPITEKEVERFCNLYLEIIPQIDILGSWIDRENLVEMYYSKTLKRIRLDDIEPFRHAEPWSAALLHKKVLIVNPLVDTIRYQYERRKNIFVNRDVLPEFKLLTYKPVMSNSASEHAPDYSTWFDALSKMQEDIRGLDFDVAIVGAGAYGLPISCFVKSLGKSAVHMGGATQLLFGIIGSRWENKDWYRTNIINEEWIRPLAHEIPTNFKKIEDGCYW